LIKFNRYKNRIKRKRFATREDRIITIANGISISRMILSIPLVYYLDKDNIPMALILIGIIIFTDLLDGWVARKVDEITHFGKLIDPVADKVCMMMIVIFLIFKIGLPMLLFFFILAIRDIILITMGIYLMFKQNRVFASNKTGKWFIFTTSLMVLSFVFYSSKSINTIYLNSLGLISYTLYFISIILFIFSSYFYFKRYMKNFKDLKGADVLSI
jgi:phosphatidylglycerophosphate synthase